MAIDPKHLSPAEELLWSYGVTEPKHIDLEAIAMDRQAKVRFRILHGCEARLVAVGESAIISLNTHSSAGRQRFSLGHELGHWIRDRQVGSFACGSDDIGPQNAEAKSVETRANEFASQLILPDYLVAPWMIGKHVNFSIAGELKHEFSSSLTAAAIKMVKRAQVPACIACHGKTKRHWRVPNLKFPSDLYVKSELHQETDAFQMAYRGTPKNGQMKRMPADRWLSGSGTFRMDVNAQSILAGEDQVLTLITLI